MLFAKNELDTLNNVFLIPPGKDRRKQFLRCWGGEIKAINDEDSLTTELPHLYFHRKYNDSFKQLRRQLEIHANKQRLTASGVLLAEAIIAMLVAHRSRRERGDPTTLLSRVSSVPARMFIGMPDSFASLASGYMEAAAGIRVNRFATGLAVENLHQRIFGKDDPRLIERKPSALFPDAAIGLWMTRDPYQCNVLTMALDADLPSTIRDLYFVYIGGHLKNVFEKEFDEDQSLYAAFGVPIFDTQRIFSEQMTRIDVVFADTIKSQTYQLRTWDNVIPAGISALGDCNTRLEKYFDIQMGECSGIDSAIKRFALFIHSANLHERGSRHGDAFLHYMIALDLALGGSANNTKNVCRRTSSIVSGGSASVFTESLKKIDAFYSARSKYVHEGREPSAEKLGELAAICTSVMECLLRNRAMKGNCRPDFLTTIWHRKLDYIAAGFDAGMEIPKSHFEESGVILSHEEDSRVTH